MKRAGLTGACREPSYVAVLGLALKHPALGQACHRLFSLSPTSSRAPHTHKRPRRRALHSCVSSTALIIHSHSQGNKGHLMSSSNSSTFPGEDTTPSNTFKRSYDQIDIDLEEENDHARVPTPSSSGSSHTPERHKRARSETRSDDESGTAATAGSGLCT